MYDFELLHSKYFSVLVLLLEMVRVLALQSAKTNLVRLLVDVLLGKSIIIMLNL